MTLREYLTIARRQRWVIVTVAVLALASAGLFLYLRTPVYEATARVFIHPDQVSLELFPSANPGAADLSAETNGVKAPDVIAAAAGESGIDASELTRDVGAVVDSKSRIVAIRAHDRSPQRAARKANAVADAYVKVGYGQRQSAALRAAADQLDAQLQTLRDRLGELDRQVADASRGPGGPATALTSLEAERAAVALQYQSTFSRQQDLLLRGTLSSGQATVQTRATPPSRPVGPRPLQLFPVALLAGSLVGLAIALLRDHLDRRVQSRQDIEDLDLEVLAELPAAPRSSKRRPPTLTAVEDPMAALPESLRNLRISLQLKGTEAPIRRLLITSAAPGEGKSFVAANFAAVLAQSDLQTVLVCADLRRDVLGEIFGVTDARDGLTSLLRARAANANGHRGPVPEGMRDAYGGRTAPSVNTGSTSKMPAAAPAKPSALHFNGDGPDLSETAAVLLPTSVPNLRVLPVGPSTRHPAEMLSNPAMASVLDDLTRIADVVLLDSPALLAVADGCILAAQADGVIVVADRGRTRIQQLQRACAMLQRPYIQLLGVVLNRVPASQSSAYGHYGPAHDDGRPDRVPAAEVDGGEVEPRVDIGPSS